MAGDFFLYRGKEKYFFADEYTVVDLETTGFHQDTEIIEIGAVRVRKQEVIETYCCLVKPERGITPFITKLTGISEEMVKDSPSIREVLPQFMAWLGDDLLVGQNVDYDLSCLYRQSCNNNLQPPENDYADTLTLSRVLLPQLTHHKLSALCEHFMIPQERAHRALDDCFATMKVYECLRNLFAKKTWEEELFRYRCARVNSANVLKKTGKRLPFHRFDKQHPFYAKRVLFIGTLKRMTRVKAEKEAMRKGAIIVHKIDHHTDYLIVGTYEENDRRHAAALRLKENGSAIQWIKEERFYELVADEEK